MNGYIGLYRGKRFEVYANTVMEAKRKIETENKIKDGYRLSIHLAEKDGEDVVHVADF